MLTERQKEVLKKIASGVNIKTIADDMKISSKTVEHHRAKACRIVGLKSTVDIVHYGISRLGVPLLFALVLLLAVLPVRAANPANPGNVVLTWVRTPDDLLTNSVTYRVQAGTNLVAGAIVVQTNLFAGTNTSLVLTNIAPATWFFTATAVQGGIESVPTPVLAYFVPANRPRPPGTFATMYLEMTLDLVNYSDVGQFRARIFVPSP